MAGSLLGIKLVQGSENSVSTVVFMAVPVVFVLWNCGTLLTSINKYHLSWPGKVLFLEQQRKNNYNADSDELLDQGLILTQA